jgi:hypothetical protein
MRGSGAAAILTRAGAAAECGRRFRRRAPDIRSEAPLKADRSGHAPVDLAPEATMIASRERRKLHACRCTDTILDD